MSLITEKVNQVIKECNLNSSQAAEILSTLRKNLENQVKGAKVDVR